MNLTNILSAHKPHADARGALNRYNDFRAALGHGNVTMGRAFLGAPTDNMKTAKTERPVWTLSLAPHRDVRALADGLSALGVDLPDATVCPWSTPACRDICVSYGGNGRYPRTQRLRAVKTAFAMTSPADFLTLLVEDIRAAARRTPNGAMRLNTFSDVAWEKVLPAEVFTWLAAYDYTKGGIKRWRAADVLGYRVTLSVSERTNVETVKAWVAEGATAAVVFDVKRGHALPANWHGIPVVDGDASDDRLADPAGVIVGLRAKGRLNEARHAEARVFIRG